MRSLLVTPSSLASSMTFIFAAATVPSPPSRSHCHRVGLADRSHPGLGRLDDLHVARFARVGASPRPCCGSQPTPPTAGGSRRHLQVRRGLASSPDSVHEA